MIVDPRTITDEAQLAGVRGATARADQRAVENGQPLAEAVREARERLSSGSMTTVRVGQTQVTLHG